MLLLRYPKAGTLGALVTTWGTNSSEGSRYPGSWLLSTCCSLKEAIFSKSENRLQSTQGMYFLIHDIGLFAKPYKDMQSKSHEVTHLLNHIDLKG